MAANILIATPQTEFGELLRLNIEESGEYAISLVKTGQEVMETANKIKFDLAILDPALPDKPFVPLAQNLLDENPSLRLVIIQAQNSAKDPALEDLSPHAYLSRPFYPPDLIEMIESLLSAPVTPLIEAQEEEAPATPAEPPEQPQEIIADILSVEQSSPVSSPIPSAVNQTTEVEQLEKELSLLEGSQDMPAGQAEIDKLLAQLRTMQAEEETETVDSDSSRRQASIQMEISAPTIQEPGEVETESQPASEQTILEEIAQQEQQTTETETSLVGQEDISTPASSHVMDGLFVTDEELSKKHKELADKYAALAAEYSRLASEHSELAARHARLASEKAQKHRQTLERLKLINPIIEKLKQLLSETSAHGALIIRDGEIVALAGEIHQQVSQDIVKIIEQNWDKDYQSDLVRFVRMDSGNTERMLYATALNEVFILCLIFDIATPLSRMRNQTLSFARALPISALTQLPTEAERLWELADDETAVQPAPPEESGLSDANCNTTVSEWIPEQIAAGSHELPQAREILQSVLNQLESSAGNVNFEDEELSLEEELVSLFNKGPQETNITTPFALEKQVDRTITKSEPEDTESNAILSSVLAQLERQSSNVSDIATITEEEAQSILQEELTTPETSLSQEEVATSEISPPQEEVATSEISPPQEEMATSEISPPQEDSVDAFPEPDIDSILINVREQLNQQSIPQATSDVDFIAQVIESVKSELFETSPQQQKSAAAKSREKSLDQEQDKVTEPLQQPEAMTPPTEAEAVQPLHPETAAFSQTEEGEIEPPGQPEAVMPPTEAEAVQPLHPETAAFSQTEEGEIEPPGQPEAAIHQHETESEDTSHVAPFVITSQADSSPDAQQILDDIFAQLEETETVEDTSEDEVTQQDFSYPWEQQIEEAVDIPTQPIRVAPPPISIPEETTTEPVSSTQPVKVRAAGEAPDKILSTVKANLIEIALQSHPSTPEQPLDSSIVEEKEIPEESQAMEAEENKREGFSSLFANLSYTCVLVPRFQETFIDQGLNNLLSTTVPKICMIFGWTLEKLEIKPNYMLWSVQVNPAVSPGNLIRVIRKRTSKNIFEAYPQLKLLNYTEDFWAPGYLVVSGIEKLNNDMLSDFIQQTYRRKNLLKTPDR
ncbi:MAG: hypothetical protein HPY45_00840 [Anaerolineae bacterium]|nr:hypothetical protein [Anaerolineae bacterium]